MIASDSKGNLRLYEKSDSSLDHIVTIQVDSKSEIKGIAINSAENYVAAGCQDGTITVFDLNAPGKERLIKPIMTVQGNKGVRSL